MKDKMEQLTQSYIDNTQSEPTPAPVAGTNATTGSNTGYGSGVAEAPAETAPTPATNETAPATEPSTEKPETEEKVTKDNAHKLLSERNALKQQVAEYEELIASMKAETPAPEPTEPEAQSGLTMEDIDKLIEERVNAKTKEIDKVTEQTLIEKHLSKYPNDAENLGGIQDLKNELGLPSFDDARAVYYARHNPEMLKTQETRNQESTAQTSISGTAPSMERQAVDKRGLSDRDFGKGFSSTFSDIVSNS